jgi:tRNA-dihydrouridine synthase
MVTKRGMGSGLICDAPKINNILNQVHNESDITVSMKMRMGYHNATEILDTFPILDQYPLKNIGIHARIGKQLYKGGVDLDAFEVCTKSTKHKLYYNGDITTVERFNEMTERFPTIDHWMIGRGLIADPFLPKMIKENNYEYPENKLELLRQFHDELFEQYQEALSGDKHLISKMYSFWEYFSLTFMDYKKALKKIKKSKSAKDYQIAVTELFLNQ